MLNGNLLNSKSSISHRLFVTSTKIAQTYYILENANKPNGKSRKPNGEFQITSNFSLSSLVKAFLENNSFVKVCCKKKNAYNSKAD